MDENIGAVLNSDLHNKIVRVYNKKVLGSKILYIGLSLICDIALIISLIEHLVTPDAIITSKDTNVFMFLAIALLLVNVAVAAEYLIVPRNVKKNKLRCVTDTIIAKKKIPATINNSEFFRRYEIHYGEDVFELACADEYEKIKKGDNVNLIYVKSAFSKKYIPLLVYLPDEKGLDYELLKEKPCTYEQFTESTDTEQASNKAFAAENYHDYLEGDKTEVLMRLEKELAKAPAGSKEQLRLMEKIGEERHEIKKINARKNRIQKLKEIIAIIRR